MFEPCSLLFCRVRASLVASGPCPCAEIASNVKPYSAERADLDYCLQVVGRVGIKPVVIFARLGQMEGHKGMVVCTVLHN